MLRAASLILISATILMFVFGAFLMLHKDGELHSGCAIVALGVRCETAMAGATAAVLHLNALAHPAIVPALAVFAILFLALALLGACTPPRLALARMHFAAVLRSQGDTSAGRALLFWLSIHEKRDPAFIAAVSA